MVLTRRSIDQSQYKPFDSVEIIRPWGVDIGVLLRKAVLESDDDDESPSPSDKTTLWVVSVQGGNDSDDKEERILSRNFGRILVAGQDENTNINKKGNPKKKSRRHVTPTKDAVSDATAVSVSEDDKAKSATKAKAAAAATTKAKATAKGVKKGGNNNNTIKDDSNNNNNNNDNDNDNQGARTTRTTRRQRGDDSGLFVGNIENIPKAKKPLKRPREPEAVNNPHETVIKVKMLTGTLFMYRGAKPRAEFIRTV